MVIAIRCRIGESHRDLQSGINNAQRNDTTNDRKSETAFSALRAINRWHCPVKIDIYKHNCALLIVHLDFVVREGCIGEFRDLLTSTANHPRHDDDSEGIHAIFASRYALDDNHLGVLVMVICDDINRGTGTICFNVIAAGDEPLARQWKGTKSVSRMLNSAPNMLDTFKGTCRAVFRYEETNGYRATSSLPIPLAVQEHGGGVTHIENATFVRRERGEVKYSVEVTEDDGTITHEVEFETNIRMNRRSFINALRQASSRSMQLVENYEEDKDAAE